jgi:carbamate kinase
MLWAMENTLTIVHGNGPQVGMINLGFGLAHEKDASSPIVDFPECGSMSQGYMGIIFKMPSMRNLIKRNIKKDVATLITQNHCG